MTTTEHTIEKCSKNSESRVNFWIQFLANTKVKKMVELGVFRGEFAEAILRQCEMITHYYMIDPWRHLDNWNKPANKNDRVFEQYLADTLSKTSFAEHKRIILRGVTTEVVDQIADGELDFAYIDGDHTLRGIAIDLIRLYPKIRDGGWIGGDDFSKTVWQHHSSFEPTLVFPFAVHFAEAVGARIYALPHAQFLLEKNIDRIFAFIDLTSGYEDTGLRAQLHPNVVLKLKLKETFPRAVRVVERLKQLLS